ncbi:uncharacterized protein LOC134247857 [Saccostrea cucullata]|uniref:uncharacterized protein LOC134247857 n=1 Tax=Saccostrea cuccullata TaxID=36930 RepID=UPI002ED1AA79
MFTYTFQRAYNERNDVYHFVPQVLALPFLPPEHIEDTFHQLDARAPRALVPVMDYVYRTWITSTVFKIDSWSIFMTAIRTNNDVEGWHNRLNSAVAVRGPVPFYSLIQELYRESKDIPLQLRLVTEGKLQRYQRKQSRHVQGKVFKFWNKYCEREISASRLLKECAAIYGPPVQ